jgi:outer membrane immunogenic protein
MNSMLTYTLQMLETRAPKKIQASGIAVLLAMASPGAFAADFPRAPAPAVAPIQQPAPVVPVWSWTGFYIGVNGGGSIGTDSNSDVFFPTGPGVNPPAVLSNDRHALLGGLVGGQIGYNWQVAPTWLFGVEGDGQWTNQRDTLTFTGQNIGGPGTSISYADGERIRSIATARARFGWIRDSFLWYVTGGGAWADINSDYTLTSTIPRTFPSPTIASFSTTKSGWTIGGGVETHLGGNWTGKLEYLFVDLGSVDHTFTSPVTAAGTFALFDATHSVRDHIIRVGLNYKFW